MTEEQINQLVSRIRNDRLIIVHQYQSALKVKKQAKADELHKKAERIIGRLEKLIDKSDALIETAEKYRAQILALRAEALDTFDEEIVA